MCCVLFFAIETSSTYIKGNEIESYFFLLHKNRTERMKNNDERSVSADRLCLCAGRVASQFFSVVLFEIGNRLKVILQKIYI